MQLYTLQLYKFKNLPKVKRGSFEYGNREGRNMSRVRTQRERRVFLLLYSRCVAQICGSNLPISRDLLPAAILLLGLSYSLHMVLQSPVQVPQPLQGSLAR